MRFFALLGVFIWKDFHTAVLITKGNPQIDMQANKKCSDSMRKIEHCRNSRNDADFSLLTSFEPLGSTLFSGVFEIKDLLLPIKRARM